MKGAVAIGGSRTAREVYPVWDEALKRNVMVKVYDDARVAARECTVLSALVGERHIVQLLDCYERDGKGYIVTEYLEGTTLQAKIKSRGSLGLLEALDVSLDVLAGLDALHAKGYIHGDLHINNIFVTEDGATKIIDFEHAVKIGRDGTAQAIRTLSDPPAKVPPESRTGVLDPSYDLYGVGYMCACMLLGAKFKQIPKNSSSDSAEGRLWSIVRKALRKEPARRHRSAREMARAVQEVRSLLV